MADAAHPNAPDAGVGVVGVVERAQRLADAVLFPSAQDVDRSRIPATHFAALREAGLFSLAGVSPSHARRALAAIAGGCGATFFVWVQHHGVVRNVASSGNDALRTSLLPTLLDGSVIGGTAFAHARRRDSIAVRATQVDGGWRLDGTAPWATSWGIAARFAVAATTDDGRLVWGMVPGDEGSGVTVRPLELPVFAATGTVAIDFDDAVIDDIDIIDVQSLNAWQSADRTQAALGQPAVLGVADRAVRLLTAAARGTEDPARSAADRLADELAARWQVDDDLTADGASDRSDRITVASAHRTACLDLGQRATVALLAAVGGGGMDLSHPAQRLAREASFYVIQAQTIDGRAATLNAT